MTVQTNTNIESFNGNGVTQIFPIAFKFNNDTDLVVLLVDDEVGEASQLTLNSDYTVSGAGDEEGGLINVVVPPSTDQRLHVSRIVDILQLTDLRNQGKFFAEVHEDALDLLTMIAQQGASSIKSSLRVPDSDPEPSRIPPAALRAGKFLAFDQDGNPTTAAPVNDSAEALRLSLASSSGAERIGRGTGTVETALQDIEARAEVIENELAVAPGVLTSIPREARVNQLTAFVSAPFRMTSKALPSSTYDHFGLMDIDSLGRPYMFFRRGTSHMDDEGKIVFTRMNRQGQWETPREVISEAGFDYPGNAGGTMQNGRIVIATNSRSMPGMVYRQIEILVSDDYGDTWVKKGEIPLGAYGYKFTYGRGCAVGDKYIMNYYCQIGSGQVEVRTIESTDGGETWQDGVLLASGNNCNETSICHLGSGVLLAVARIGPGNTGKMRQFLSTDGGDSWTNQGELAPEISDGAATLVTPDLALYTSSSGTPHIILTYTDRTAKLCVYRTIPVAKAVAGVTGWSQRSTIYSAPNSSGYQNTVVTPSGQVIGNLFRETVADAITQAAQFELYPGDIPDYESDLVSVSALGAYTLAHGLQRRPHRVEIWFTPDPLVFDLRRMTAMVTVVSGSPVGSGAQVRVTATGIEIGTGTYVWGTGAFGSFDNSAATRYTAGYYRVRAWI